MVLAVGEYATKRIVVPRVLIILEIGENLGFPSNYGVI